MIKVLLVDHVDDDVRDVVHDARATMQVLLLTDSTAGADAAVRGSDAVDGVVSGAELGLARPDPDLFSAIALREGLLLGELAVVDSAPEMIAAAEMLGMSGRTCMPAGPACVSSSPVWPAESTSAPEACRAQAPSKVALPGPFSMNERMPVSRSFVAKREAKSSRSISSPLCRSTSRPESMASFAARIA